jgi:radical SAM superfamily enzyme YgiQ (UPF0313 family)
MSSKVLLLHPYIPSRFNGAPIGLLYLAAALEKEGHTVRLVDLQANPSTLILNEVLETFQPSIVGISSTSPSHKPALELAKKVKQKYPDIFVIKGGVHETYCATHTLSTQPYIDYCMVGEADVSFPLLVNALESSLDLEAIPGLAYRNNGRIIINPENKSLINLDALPLPARSLLSESTYYNFKIFDHRKTTQVQTMRGCPFQCSFCNQRNRRVLARSTNNVLEELKLLQSQEFEGIFFDDATFTVNMKRTTELVKSIINEGLKLEMGCQTRSDLVAPDLIETMAAAGVRYISFGLETVDEDTLKILLKTKSTQQHMNNTANAIHYCREFNILSCLNLIVGLPNETIDTLRRTFEFVNKLNPNYVSLSVLALYPHEDSSTAQIYTDGISTEPVWQFYDEGYGAIHPYLNAEQADKVLSLASSYLGQKLNLV